jgi:hypothetical protein
MTPDERNRTGSLAGILSCIRGGSNRNARIEAKRQYDEYMMLTRIEAVVQQPDALRDDSKQEDMGR